MPSVHAPLSRQSNGFILLHTLWLLLATSTLVAGVLAIASRTSMDLALAEQEVRRELAQESAVELVIHDILTRGSGSRWLRPPLATDTVDIEGHRILLTVQNVSGLVDAGTGHTKVLAALLAEVLDVGGANALARIGAARGKTVAGMRPFSTYAELRAAVHLSDRDFNALYRHVTIFSERSLPDPLLATPGLATVLQLNRGATQPISAMEARVSAAGSTYRIEAISVSADDPGSQILSVEVTITGRIRPSHLIRSWQYLPRSAAG